MKKEGGLEKRGGRQGNEVGLGGEEQQFMWEHTEFGVPIRHSSGIVEYRVGLSSGERFRLEMEARSPPHVDDV